MEKIILFVPLKLFFGARHHIQHSGIIQPKPELKIESSVVVVNYYLALPVTIIFVGNICL